PGDVFLDLEGDRFVVEGGFQYLFGWVTAGQDGRLDYRGLWALDAAGERLAFETFLDEVAARRERWPDLHVYHFAPYEPAALKRLMGRHATREEALDRMLRAELFVDLHAVAKQAVRASVERYGLKELEAFTGFTRELPLEAARAALREAEWALELGRAETLTAEARHAIESYNRDDCLSARALRDWLEGLRDELIARGEAIGRPTDPGKGEPSEGLDEWLRRVRGLEEALLADLPADPAARAETERARWLLAHTLEWFRREEKVVWWEFFRLQKASAEDLFDEPAGAAGLQLLDTVGGTARCPVHRYRWAPDQEVRLKPGDTAHAGENEIGTIEEVDPAQRTLDIRKRSAAAALHPEAVFGYFVVPRKEPEGALLRLAEDAVQVGIEGSGLYGAARALLLRQPPAPAGTDLLRPGETAHEAALRLALDDGIAVLPIQGPPGSGKTYTAARMACAVVRAGKKVGISAMSHKVIRHLLEKIREAAAEEGIPVRLVQKVKSGDEAATDGGAIREVTENKDIEAAIAAGDGDVFAGTAWLWAREQVRESVDVLIVDEAGQMSLALALAASQGGRRLVLVGDPQQLEQPLQGSHPEGTAVSALEHLLGERGRDGRGTLAPHQGLFLEETRRLHPAICDFTSELFYDARLRSRPGLDGQMLVGGPIPGAGLWFLPVEHAGNQSSSPEEAEAVAGLVRSLTDGTVIWVDRKGDRQPLTLEQILVVAPYNLQVEEISRRLPDGARVGTVDRFQGQEAAVVLFSTATSTPEDAPRGMEFLYSPSRLNVATSRARSTCVLVGSPRLFEPECRTPRQMRLANAFCRYLELARAVDLSVLART
ncbi:MAG: DEAD/DEAH box helicase, partial [Thermoanaerobaculia bacterium]